jgi:hypothetical protein
MQKDIEVLKECIRILVKLKGSNDWIEVAPAIEKAIKCMQLLPELVKLDRGHSMYCQCPECDVYYIKLEEAKELLNDGEEL